MTVLAKRPIRGRIARQLVRLAARIDRRPYVSYEITFHSPQGWQHIAGGKR
ncbi:hypothetical protein [Mycolicibacterium poriferae]|jgi:hypothetical protein|uniref:hypothetical protein n=1 Tax=Mycolicibacterium poriferae TaxID=39694 RepID=UPI0024B8A388|nr:hypothetical protein [Mycolicibacterium poriferae]